MIKSARFATGLICFGLLLLGVSYMWPLLLPQEVVWSEEQALEKSNAAADLHRMSHEAGHVVSDSTDEEEKKAAQEQLQKAQSRFDESKAALDRGRRFRDITAIVLRSCGIVFALMGVIRYKIIQSDDRNQRS